MSDLDKALDALTDDERAIIDSYASEYLSGIKDSVFRKAWMDLRLTDDSKQRRFIDADEFAECLHQYQTDTAYRFAMHRRTSEIELATEHKTHMDFTNRFREVA
ncbi:hypothetical protein [Serratia marcescens]|uniref:Uncharacterized protein n=1 Tax=Serratia marcescens TaxID=615 RepID=A0A9X8VDG9_SERMA|nr:hypothetical protein [Serratia marcescens]MBS3895033.1 hypothetical protein [Serratia marcescens]